MWLDGLYMGGPICAEYAKRFDVPEFTELVIEQILMMFDKTKDEKLAYYIMLGTIQKRQYGQIP